jgi:hypothetical protein
MAECQLFCPFQRTGAQKGLNPLNLFGHLGVMGDLV